MVVAIGTNCISVILVPVSFRPGVKADTGWLKINDLIIRMKTRFQLFIPTIYIVIICVSK